jgi:hypothetical protein
MAEFLNDNPRQLVSGRFTTVPSKIGSEVQSTQAMSNKIQARTLIFYGI